MPSRAYDFKCTECGSVTEEWVDSSYDSPHEWAELNHCVADDGEQLCGGKLKRIYNFGQFTFKGGLPSNHGRKGVFR